MQKFTILLVLALLLRPNTLASCAIATRQGPHSSSPAELSARKLLAGSCLLAPPPPLYGSWPLSCFNKAAGTTCRATCLPGYGTVGATPVAVCQADGTWAMQGICGGCPNSLLPLGTWGPQCAPLAVTPTPNGGSCTATCPAGYSGAPVAVCRGNTWNVTQACALNCLVAPLQLPQLGQDVTISWQCPNVPGTPTVVGGVCSGTCAAGYTGSLQAVCQAGGLWTYYGSCTVANAVPNLAIAAPAATGCTSGLGLPLLQIGQNSTTSWQCPSPAGTTQPVNGVCNGTCATGYIGSLQAVCQATGLWGYYGTCTSTTCLLAPPFLDKGAWPIGCLNVVNGTKCNATCSSGVGTLPNGASPVATCVNGNWTVSGACAGCSTLTLPLLQLGQLAWTCPANTGVLPPTAFCTSQCLAGYAGTPKATCTAAGNWTVSGACAGCSTLTLPLGPLAWTCPANTGVLPPNAFCTRQCAIGYTGTPKATCSAAGTWTTTGTCTPTTGR